MGESAIQLPNKSIVLALFKKGAEVKQKTSSISSEYGERIKAQIENGNLHRRAYSTAEKIAYKALTNEIAALQEISHLRYLLDIVEDEIRKKGHVGDLAEQADAASKADTALTENAMPLDQAEKAFEANAHKAPKPEEVEAAAQSRARGRKSVKSAEAKEPDSVDQFRADMKSGREGKGRKGVKAVADGYVEEQNKRLGAANDSAPLDDDFDDLAPPPAPAAGSEPPEFTKRSSGRTGLGPDAIH